MKKGDIATMLFHGFGEVSEEECEVLQVKDGIVTLYTDDDLDKCFKFDIETGRCINDVTDFGCRRTLKLED